MTGGIYCEVTLGNWYEEKVLGSVHSRMQKLIGTSKGVPTNKELSEFTINTWYKTLSRKMGRTLSSWKVPGGRGYYNRTVDLTRSICLGIYYNGNLERSYRFTGGKSEKGAFEASDMGTEPSSATTAKLAHLGMTRHPDPAYRAQQFLKDYNLTYKRGYTIVIAATMPYAVRLEKGLRLPVLSLVINRLLSDVYEFKGQFADATSIFRGAPLYGYIFESTGGYQ